MSDLDPTQVREAVAAQLSMSVLTVEDAQHVRVLEELGRRWLAEWVWVDHPTDDHPIGPFRSDPTDHDAEGRHWSRPVPRPATPAEVLAAAATLDGAETFWRCLTHECVTPSKRGCFGKINCRMVEGRWFPLPDKEAPTATSLPDKETTDEG